VGRLLYIDWLRGVAVLFMVLWHTVDAWTRPDDRTGLAFDIVLFAAGWAAPMFLFFAGASVPLAGSARLARGLDRAAASGALQRRGWQIFLLAHVFRFQSFLLNPGSSWNAILKPDILNILGLGIVLSAWLWKRAGDAGRAAVWLLGPAALAVVVLTPWSRAWWWPTLLHPRFEAYVRPVGNSGVFSLFPTIGYVLVGAFVGVILSAVRDEPARLHRRLAIGGTALVLLGGAASTVEALQVPTAIDSAPSFVWRTGAIVLALALSWATVGRRASRGRSPLVILGQTSLFVYWVHVEIAYGVFSYPIRRTMTLPASLTAFAALMVVLTALSVLWQRRLQRPLIPPHMTAGGGELPGQRSSGQPG
jgi:uncharacterized membrane protein